MFYVNYITIKVEKQKANIKKINKSMLNTYEDFVS